MKQLFSLALLSFIIFSCGKVSNSNSGAVPSAPSALTATLASSPKVNLSWTDNSTDESGFKIERKTGTGSYGLISITASNVTTYIDTLVSNNTNYTYRVYSYNSTGNSSTYTNEASIYTSDTTAPQDTMATKIKIGLVAWYPFTGNANDSSGNGNDGIINGATLTADRAGVTNSAYRTSAGYISAPSFSIPTSGIISISYWFNCNSDFGLGEIICLGSSSSTTWGCVGGDNYFTMNYGRGCGSTGSTPILQPLTYGTWHHVVFISNGLNANTKIYFDGLLIGTSTNANSSNSCSHANLYIGADIYGLGNFDGKLDDIRIWNRAITASEITYLANH